MARYIDADVARRIIDSPRSKEQMLLVLSQAEPADVVSKEKYDELNENYHRLLESAKILSDAVREYERREDEQIH